MVCSKTLRLPASGLLIGQILLRPQLSEAIAAFCFFVQRRASGVLLQTIQKFLRYKSPLTTMAYLEKNGDGGRGTD